MTKACPFFLLLWICCCGLNCKEAGGDGPAKAETPTKTKSQAAPKTPSQTPAKTENEGAPAAPTAPAASAADKAPPPPLKPAQDSKPKKFKFSGYTRHRYYRDLEREHPSEHADELRNDLRLTGEFDPTSTVKLLVSVDGRLDPVRSDREGFTLEEERLRLWEAYVKASMGPVDLRVGRQVIRWGKSDELNPIDNFTPEDFSEFINFDRAERKLPAWMVRADFQINKEFTYETVWQPFFEPDVLPPKDSDWYFPGLRAFKPSTRCTKRSPPRRSAARSSSENGRLPTPRPSRTPGAWAKTCSPRWGWTARTASAPSYNRS